MLCKTCHIQMVWYTQGLECPICKAAFGYDTLYNDHNREAFRLSLEGYEDPNYETVADMLYDMWINSFSERIKHFQALYNQYKGWIRSELDRAEGEGWEKFGADCDYYAIRDRREAEIKQVVGTPYDYYITLLNNDTEYDEWGKYKE